MTDTITEFVKIDCFLDVPVVKIFEALDSCNPMIIRLLTTRCFEVYRWQKANNISEQDDKYLDLLREFLENHKKYVRCYVRMWVDNYEGTYIKTPFCELIGLDQDYISEYDRFCKEFNLEKINVKFDEDVNRLDENTIRPFLIICDSKIPLKAVFIQTTFTF
jgi:hypothetical protein